MKNFVKQILTVLFSILVFFIASAEENTNESAELIASATVQGALSITKDADVSFGNISATTDGIVRLVPNGSSSSYVGSNATTGKLTINGAGNASVLISYPAGVTLIANSSDQLAYSLHVYGHNEDIQSSSVQLTSEGVASENVIGSLDGTSGNYFIYVGGALGGTIGAPAALSNQAAGEYTGTVIFEVKYN